MNLTVILKNMAIIASHAPMIAELRKQGQPLMQAIRDNAPELKTALGEIAAATFKDACSCPSTAPASLDAHEKAIAKAVFEPQAISPDEKAWMDHASQVSGL